MILMKLPLIVLFIISLAGYLSSEALKGYYSKLCEGNKAGSYKYTAIVSGVSAVTLILLSGFSFPFSWFSFWLGLLFGVAIMGLLCASSLAIQIGPWSYTTVMVSLAIIIPAFSGAIFWGEKLTWLDFVGLAFMVSCLFLSVQKQSDDKKGNVKWLILSIVAMIFMAGVGLLQKTHQSSMHKSEVTVFLIVAFAFSFICSTGLYFLMKRKKGQMQDREILKKTKYSIIATFLSAGIAMALNHTINLYLSGSLDSILFFPVMCGCELIGVTLMSLLLFKEKLTKKQWLGLFCGVIAVLLLCI